MRKFFVNYTPYRGHERIRAIMEGSSYQYGFAKAGDAEYLKGFAEIPVAIENGVSLASPS